MKKRYFTIITLSLVFMMLVAASGCGVRINGKEYEFFNSGSTKKEHSDIFNAVGPQTTERQEITQDGLKGDELVVSTGAGNIDIKEGGSSEIVVIADKKVRGASEETKKKILENMIISVEDKSGKVELAVKTSEGKSFWDWQKDNYKTYQVTINYDIELPDSIKEVNLSTGAGNILVEGKAEKVEASTGAGNVDINSMMARFKISTGAGNITIKDSSAKEDCELNTGAGNVDFIGDVIEVDNFKASTGMGNVDFRVPADSKMTLDASTGLGNLSGSFITISKDSKSHFKGDINGGGSDIILSTGVGNITADEN